MSTPLSSRAKTAIASIAAASLITLAVPTVAFADPIVPMLSGAVTLDTNANGAIDATTADGFVEAGQAGVQIDVVCVATDSVILTTTSDAAGAWAFENFDLAADQLGCPDGVVVVRATVLDDRYSITDASGVNETPRTADPQVGESVSITLTDSSTEVVNTLTRPDWYLDLTIPFDAALPGPAVYDGTAPFDAACTEPGTDCAVHDDRVRSGDTVTYTWSITASSQQDLVDTNEAVILEQTIDFVDGAIANFSGIPARCKPSGGGGAEPASQIVTQAGVVVPEGTMPPVGTTSVTLRCNLGEWESTGDVTTFQPVVLVSPLSPNGSSMTTTARVYSVDPVNGTPTAVPAADVSYGPTEISAAPAYEVEKKGFFNLDPGYNTVTEGGVSEPGWYTYAVIQIKTNRKVGAEALQQPITLTDDIFGAGVDGVTALGDLEFRIISCIPNPTGWAGTVGGRPDVGGDFVGKPEYTVPNSGTCTRTREDDDDPTSDYTLTFSGIDMSGARYPTRSAGGADLSAGPFYVASYRIQIFIPFRVVDATNGVMGDSTGSVSLYNRLAGFDPDGVSGASNFGSGTEPGYCEPESVDGINLNDPEMPFCDPQGTNVPNVNKSDNVIGPTTIYMAPGNFSKSHQNNRRLWTNVGTTLHPNQTSWHGGDAVLQPGQVFDTRVYWGNRGSAEWTNSQMCDVFDNTMGKIVPSSRTVTDGRDDLYAWLIVESPPDFNATNAAKIEEYNANWIFEYGHIEIPAGDDPLAGGTLNPVTGRYDGTWNNQSAATCDDAAAVGGWQTDPALVPGGIDEVNAVRVRPATPDVTQRFATVHQLTFGIEVRDAFYGGPHDGEPIPSGAVLADYGSVRTDQENGGKWIPNQRFDGDPNTVSHYRPSPETGHTDGDRVTIARATLSLQKRTVEATEVDGGALVGDGVSNYGITGTAVAGNDVIWEVAAAVQADSADPAPVENLTITDVLPPYATYDEACTAGLVGGTVADEVQLNTPNPGKTTLVWHLGTWTPNVDVPNRLICTNTDPLAPRGTTMVNWAQIQYDGSPLDPEDTHTVTLEQTGDLKLRKAVDAPLDVLNDDQEYSLTTQNFSGTLTVAAPTLIEVFPYNGDGSPLGGVNRSPESSFHGDLVLTTTPVSTYLDGSPYPGELFYTTDDPATIHQDLNENTSTWVSAGSFSGALADVTGLKFVGTGNLTPLQVEATSGFELSYTMQAGDTADPFSAQANRAGDIYSNRFSAFSQTFMSGTRYQLLASNRTLVETVSHSNGDIVFEDRDGDGLYTEGRDVVVPDGVTVNLYYESAGGDVLVGSTSTLDGLYLFTELPPGDYHVEIPASEFESGGLLEGYSLTVAPAAGSGEAAVDENDDVSHDAISGTGGSIISHSFTLSATVDPTTTSVSGDEPTGENIHGITDPTTTDPFSNLAIDLALQQEPGIDIEKEVCTLAENSCDPSAPLGAGGWSVDGVDGVGPTTEAAERPYGSAVLWRIIVTNTGEQYLTDVEVADEVTADCAATDADVADFADFAPGDVEIYTCETASITSNITPNTADVVGTPQGSDQTLTDIDTANATTTGSLVINKVITGPGSAAFGAGPFTFEVLCTLDGDEVYKGTVTLTPEGGASAVTSDPISGLPLGSSCVVTETGTGGADETPAAVTVEIVSNDQDNTVIVEISNEFSQGILEVTKVLEGTATDQEYVLGLEFEILVTCQVESISELDEAVLGTVYSGTITIKGGETVVIADEDGNPILLPFGTHCFGEETNSAGAAEATVDFDSFENAAIVEQSDEEQLLTITATNVFDTAEIVVKKVVIGLGSPGPYTFELECTINGGTPYPLDPEDASFSLSNGETRTIQVLVGVECTVTETNVPASAIVSMVDSDDATAGGSTDGTVVASSEGEAVTVTNQYTILASTGSMVDLRTPILVGGGFLLLGAVVVFFATRRRKTAGT